MMHESSSARVGVLGATGYTGRELIRLLLRHPRAEITFATSESEAGSSLRRINRGAPELALSRASEADLAGCDIVFSCLPHGASQRWVGEALAAGARAIDLSADLRVPNGDTPSWAADAVYGLPELHREALRGARLVANPGCYPTGAILGLAPALRRGMLRDAPVLIDAASGVTGAGRSPKRELLFAEIAEDFRAYAVGNVHRHLGEMRHQTELLAGTDVPELVFTPHLLPVRSGILETIYVPVRESLGQQEATALWMEDYQPEPFVDVLDGETPSLAQVVGTNRVALSVTPVSGVREPLLLVIAALDNLVKGAAGQAVQNMNLLFGWEETEALL